MALPTRIEIEAMPEFTVDRPMRILVSACLAGERCGVDGTSNGEYPWIGKLISMANVKSIRFCPEDYFMGTPRNVPDIHGGNGFDVLDGRARVITDKGEDCTDGMIRAAYRMLEMAKSEEIDVAVLMDMSAACGSQVISDGCRLIPGRKYQKGPGVCAALLLREGFRVISQRDFQTLELIFKKLNPTHVINSAAADHHQTEWYRNYFGAR